MSHLEESFTERIIRRASLRKHWNKNEALKSSEKILKRRFNILRAINDPAMSRRGSCNGINDSQRFDQSYDSNRDCFDVTDISCNNNNDENSIDAYKKIDENSEKLDSKKRNFFRLGNVKSFETLKNRENQSKMNLTETMDRSLRDSSIGDENLEEEPEKLLKVTEDDVNSFAKVEAAEKPSKTENIDFTFDFDSSRTSTAAVIDDSDYEEGENLLEKNTFTTEAVVEMCKQVYTALDVNCESEDLECVKINEINSRCNSKDMNKMLNSCDNIVKSESEAATLESTGQLARFDTKRMLFSTESLVNCEESEKWEDNDSIFNDTTPYDEEKFLADALGDELCMMSVTYDNISYAINRTHSDFTASDLISEDEFPVRRKVTQALKLPTSEPSSPMNSSSTLDKSMRIYRSLSQRIKKTFRPSLKLKKELEIVTTIPSGTEEIDTIQDLLQEVKTQQTLMNERAKVLHLFDTKKEFLSSTERIESERTLLLASLRRKAALEEIKAITSEEEKESVSFCEKAEITVGDINLALRDSLRQESQNNEMSECFVVAVSQGLNVWLTSPISRSANQSRIKFSESISIPNLTPGFKITVQVYSLRLGRSEWNEEKKRMAKQSSGTSCLSYSLILASPTKLFKKAESSVSSIHNHDQNNIWKKRNSSFVLSGFTELSIQDLSSSSTRSLIFVPTNSNLKGSIDLNISCRLHLATSHQGFLNFYEEFGDFGSWTRRWCVLKGHTLMFWNYPREQDVKKPLKVIELMACVSNEITTVDRTICPKPRTLLIETERHKIPGDRNSMILDCTSSSTFIRNLLSYDTAQELIEWSEKLNRVLLALEEWRIIGQRSQPQVSEL